MKIAKLIRLPSDIKQTLGAMIVQDGQEPFVCKSLELPWLNNQHDISCIPTGTYICKWTQSPLFTIHAGKPVFTYEVQNVKDRSGIRIHSANYYTDLKGCIGLGDSHKDINMDGELDIIHSGITLDKFNEIMNQEDFQLTIEDV